LFCRAASNKRQANPIGLGLAHVGNGGGAKNHVYYWHAAVGRTFCVAQNHRQFELSVTLHP